MCCLLSIASIVPSLICDVDSHPIFFCGDFAAHSILVQDEVLQDTTAGQALRDSWRTAVPNARSLVGLSRPTRGSRCMLFQCCFLCRILLLFLSWRIKVIKDTFDFWIGSMIIPVKMGTVADIQVGMEALMIWSIPLEISPRMERQSFQEI